MAIEARPSKAPDEPADGGARRLRGGRRRRADLACSPASTPTAPCSRCSPRQRDGAAHRLRHARLDRRCKTSSTLHRRRRHRPRSTSARQLQAHAARPPTSGARPRRSSRCASSPTPTSGCSAAPRTRPTRWGEWTHLRRPDPHLARRWRPAPRRASRYLDKNCVALNARRLRRPLRDRRRQLPARRAAAQAGHDLGLEGEEGLALRRGHGHLLRRARRWRWAHDKPAPIIIGRAPISAHARVAYPWPGAARHEPPMPPSAASRCRSSSRRTCSTITIPAPTRGIIQSENEAFMQPGGAHRAGQLGADHARRQAARRLHALVRRCPRRRRCISAFEYVSGNVAAHVRRQRHQAVRRHAPARRSLVKGGQTSGNYSAAQMTNAGGDCMIVGQRRRRLRCCALRRHDVRDAQRRHRRGRRRRRQHHLRPGQARRPASAGHGLVYVWKYRNRLFFIQDSIDERLVPAARRGRRRAAADPAVGRRRPRAASCCSARRGRSMPATASTTSACSSPTSARC